MLIFHQLLLFSLYIEVFTSDLLKKRDVSHTDEALIFSLCKKDYQTIVINDDSEEFGLTSLQQLHEQFHSVILHKSISKYQSKLFNVSKVDAIVITLSSSKDVKPILKMMRSSLWRDVMTPVYILNLPDNNCTIARKILERMWEYNILTSYFLCENGHTRVYTYNPFTNRAPENWIEVKKSATKPNWTLYKRTFNPALICKGLDFDRTKYLDGHQINVASPQSTRKSYTSIENCIHFNRTKYPQKNIKRRKRIIINALTRTLNMTVCLFYIKETDSDSKCTEFNGILKDNPSTHLILIDCNVDTIEHMKLKSNTLTRTYPLAWSEYGLASYNRGYRTLAEKIWNFYGIWTILFTIFMLIVTFTVVWFTESKKTSFAVFEIIRLLISHGLHTRMNTLPLRIFFITILIYFLIVQATFNGHLAKFLTKPELRKHPETVEDLTELGYTKVYDTKYVKYNLSKTPEEKEGERDRAELCVDHILYNDSSVVCNFDRMLLLNVSRQNKNLYVSKKPSRVKYSAYMITNHWSLSKRLNWLLVLLDDLGFRTLKSDKKLIEKAMHNLTVAEARSNEKFQPIKLDNLMFSFVILAVGLICATLSFCVEVVISQYSKWNVIPRIKNFKNKTLKLMNRIYVLCKYRR